eukprot:CAMPEP_0172328990 /NCGR_PEP_ID=MMETSP1058-20130122/60645_1 /TAXON_ID=83371 /ORGANISM="Detonula confervacea, Strain CCMP 353" /LENGTH=291 /DNA_ID=CAMNT_0013046135 /DNA_START=429 /DNA_END=1304 /DNA_ORIENTATION=-
MRTSPLDATKQSNNNNAPSRRQLIHGIVTGAILSSSLLLPKVAQAAQTPLERLVRVEEIGNGLDLTSPPPLSSSEVFYPTSMTNTNWQVQRVLTSVEGDVGQAGLAWKLLGGSSDELAFTSKLTEVYEEQYIAAPEEMKDAFYKHDLDQDGKLLQAAISDRGCELSSRTGLEKDAVQWNTKGSNSIDYTRDKDGAVTLTVVQRKIEPPSDTGFGSDEVYRIQASAGGIFAGTNVDRAARVRRRYRRGFDEATGKRILDCIEIVTTHRVLDGIAGMEFPTSTCKSRLRLTQL